MQLHLTGTTRPTRLYLAGCVRRYLTFLKVTFFADADQLWSRLLPWLERSDSPFNRPHHTEFIRAHIEDHLAQFWNEVRLGGSASTSSDCNFEVAGDVWRLWGKYEELMFMKMDLDLFPHTAFFASGGEYSKIKTSGVGVV